MEREKYYYIHLVNEIDTPNVINVLSLLILKLVHIVTFIFLIIYQLSKYNLKIQSIE